MLEFSKNNEINSKTKLNKLLARLNLFMIPVDINFSLNRFGSFTMDIQDLETNKLFQVSSYNYKEREIPYYKIQSEGKILVEKIIKQKLSKILSSNEIVDIKIEIETLSELRADEIADNEHCKLLVDVEDRFKLAQRINTVFIDMIDLYDKIKNIKESNEIELKLNALIEYCYFLSKYLKEKRFKNIENEDYDYDSRMLDYYFLYNLEKIIPKLKEEIIKETKNRILINKFYQYFINNIGDYPFSLKNPDLKELID